MGNTLKGEHVIVKGVCCFWVSLILLLLPGTLVWSANLGDITVRSGLDEPLSAEFNLLDVEIGELNTIEARPALAEEIERFDVQAVSDSSLSFETTTREDGSTIILVSSETPIEQPLVRLLIALEQHEATTYYEYQFLLAPSDSEYGGLARVFAPTRPKAIGARSQTANEGTTGANAVVVAGSSYGPIKRSENLITIAKSIEIPQNYSIYQKLYGMLVKNPHAFIISNMNLLRAGVVLDIPTVEDIGRVPRVLAMETYIRQAAEWHQYRLQFQTEPTSEMVPQQPDPAVKLMEVTVGELRKEIDLLRILLENSVAEHNRTAELKEEEVQFRKQLEGDITRLEASKTSLLATIADIRKVPVVEDPILSRSSDAASIEESTANQENVTEVDGTDSTVLLQGEFVSELRQRLSTVENQLVLRVVENDQLQSQIELMMREGEATAESVRSKDKALKIAQQEAAVYAAALESLRVESDNTSEIMIIEGNIESDKTEVAKYSTNQKSLEAASTEPSSLSESSLADSVPASARSSLERGGLVLIGIGIGLFVSLIAASVNKNRARATETLKRGSVSGRNRVELGTPLSDRVHVDSERVEEAQTQAPIGEQEIELDSKLDLARAYIEMKDEAAAKKLLVEVEARGTRQQKAQARQFLKTIG